MRRERCDRVQVRQNREALAPVPTVFLLIIGTAFLLSACASPTGGLEKGETAASASAPEWHMGDRWCHAWTEGTDKGSKSSEMVGVRVVNGVRYYVLRVGNVDRYYTSDLGWAANVIDNKVAARAVPPQPWFMWPLAVGKHWEYTGTFEDRDRKDQLHDSYTVTGEERVVVPAGTFQTFKLVREGGAAGSDQYWYSPEVRWYVKWVGRRGGEEFQEALESCMARSKGGLSAPYTKP